MARSKGKRGIDMKKKALATILAGACVLSAALTGWGRGRAPCNPCACGFGHNGSFRHNSGFRQRRGWGADLLVYVEFY